MFWFIVAALSIIVFFIVAVAYFVSVTKQEQAEAAARWNYINSVLTHAAKSYHPSVKQRFAEHNKERTLEVTKDC
jgi:hypothetical protein